MNFVKFLRPFKNPFNNNFALNTIRGAKRKGEKKQEGVFSEHILNVYKNAEDVTILPDEYYPPWVFELAREPMELEEMLGSAFLGIAVANPIDQHTMRKKCRRMLKFKHKNRMRHAYAQFDKKWDMQPEGQENQLDAEFGNLPDTITEMIQEEIRSEGAEEGQKQGGGAPAEKKA